MIGAIADGILDGSLKPGVRLDEAGLAEQHGVSRTPVREALRQLAMSGLIDMRPRKGAVVSKATPDQVESLFVAMAEMEATCARLAAMSMTPVERRRLQARHESMNALARAGDPQAYSDANVAFHSAIYAGSHNAPLAEYGNRSARCLEDPRLDAPPFEHRHEQFRIRADVVFAGSDVGER